MKPTKPFSTKRSINDAEDSLALKVPAPMNPGSPAVAPQTKTQEQLLDGLIAKARQVTGTHTREFAEHIIVQIATALVCPKPKGDLESLIGAVAAVSEMAPQNATEAMLATQMIAVNDAALLFLRRATLEDQTFQGADANVLRATRLMRIFREQLEAMQKLKGKTGQQRVTVEHVHIHEGGQAVVGAVNTRGVGHDIEN